VSAADVETWHRFGICRIDDLSNAVLGGDLDVVQMPGARASGSLVFAARDGIVFSSGLINGNVMMRGPLSAHELTVGIILRAGPGTRLWLNEVRDGAVGVVLPGDECDFLCTPGSLYVAATLTPKQLRNEVAREGQTVSQNFVSRTSLHSAPIEPRTLSWLKEEFAVIHDARTDVVRYRRRVGNRLLIAVVNHFALGQQGDGQIRLAGQARIVRDACKYIRTNVARPISIQTLSSAVEVPPRSLFRAFSKVLGDTPQDYVRRLRLHRIRRELISNSELTVSEAAHKWGVGQDLGRLSRMYRDLFGENPSSTLALGHSLRRGDTWM
jgi:AraC-like DNA-binding protein